MTTSATNLHGKTVAIISTDGFEQSELLKPKQGLEDLGATVHVISINDAQEIRGWDDGNWGETVAVDKQIGDANLSDYDAVVLPGGQINPDVLRTNKTVVAFIEAAAHEQSIKALAAICHAPWLLAEADVIKDKNVTCYPSISTDIKNAGAHYTDESVVVDGKLITSRNPDDLPNFIEAIAQAICR